MKISKLTITKEKKDFQGFSNVANLFLHSEVQGSNPTKRQNIFSVSKIRFSAFIFILIIEGLKKCECQNGPGKIRCFYWTPTPTYPKLS